MKSLLCMLLLGCYTAEAVKIWQPSDSMDEPSNWKRFPSGCDRVLLNKNVDQTIIMSQNPNFRVNSLVLPRQGVLRFPHYSTLTFASKEVCFEPITDAEFDTKSSRNWLDPDNWISDVGLGGWKPHKDMIPGAGEAIIFNSSVANVDLPTVLSPYASITVHNMTMDADGWNNYLQTEEGFENFHGTADLKIKKWRFTEECKCHKPYIIKDWTFEDVDEEVLHSAMCKYAETRKLDNLPCYEGVQPVGHCYPICGSVINFGGYPDDGSLERQLLESETMMIINAAIEAGLSGRKIPYYVGLTPSGDIQVVLVAQDGDSLKTATLAQRVIDSVRNEMPKWQTKVTLKYSGLSKGYSVGGSVAGLMLGTLAFILSLFAAIYYVYVVLPTNSSSRLGRLTQRNPFAFARFKNKLQNAVSNETLAFETEPPPTPQAESFVNPLFRPNLPGPSHQPKLMVSLLPQPKEDEIGVTLMEISKSLDERKSSDEAASSELGLKREMEVSTFSQLTEQTTEESDDEGESDLRPY